MYTPKHFEENRPEQLQALCAKHPLGLLITQTHAQELQANAVPFMLEADPAGGPGIVRAHIARANPLWQDARLDVDSLVVFQGPQAYVSPSFYASKAVHGKVVPTWNYMMVQARGKLRVIDNTACLHAFLTRLTDLHEKPRVNPWALSDAPADFIASLLPTLIGIEITLNSLQGKWKMSQNRSAADQAGVARGLQEAGVSFDN
jgi:transcriptional regulator